MDPLRLVVRVVFAYVTLLVLVRVGGKRVVKHASAFEFALSLILADMVDDLLWGDVDASVFVVGVGVLLLMHTALDVVRFRTASWR
jgi:uncharacterized membrane protein YcaP (DUF421 family)